MDGLFMKPLEELLEIAKSAKESFHKELPLKVVDEWKAFWMNQKQNNEKDYQNYWRRAFGIDANMSHHLANKIEKNFNIPQLADAVIDLITQLKDAQVEIDWRKDNYYKLDDVNCKLNERIVKLEQRLAECETALKSAVSANVSLFSQVNSLKWQLAGEGQYPNALQVRADKENTAILDIARSYLQKYKGEG